MPYKLIAPLFKTFILEETDKVFGNDGEPTTVTIKQAAQRENELRLDVNNEFRRIETEEGFAVSSKYSISAVDRMEVFLTMVDCNILDSDGTPLFTFKNSSNGQFLAMSQREFASAWGKLDPVVAKEIHEKVLEVNITWRPLENYT